MRCQVQLFFISSSKPLTLSCPERFGSCCAPVKTQQQTSQWNSEGFGLRRNRAAQKTDKRLGLKWSGFSLTWTAGMESVRSSRNNFSKSKSWQAIMGWINTELLTVVSAFFPLICRLAKHHREIKNETKNEKAKLNKEREGTNYCQTSWSFPLT